MARGCPLMDAYDHLEILPGAWMRDYVKVFEHLRSDTNETASTREQPPGHEAEGCWHDGGRKEA